MGSWNPSRYLSRVKGDVTAYRNYRFDIGSYMRHCKLHKRCDSSRIVISLSEKSPGCKDVNITLLRRTYISCLVGLCLFSDWSRSVPNLIARGPLLVSKSKHGSSNPCSCKYRVPGWQVSKIKRWYIRTDYRYILDRYIPVARYTALQDLTLIKPTVARFVGILDFLINPCPANVENRVSS